MCLDELEAQQKNTRKQLTENTWISNCKPFYKETELTEELAHALIDRVDIGSDNRISITLRYRDEYRTLLRILETSRGEVSV